MQLSLAGAVLPPAMSPRHSPASANSEPDRLDWRLLTAGSGPCPTLPEGTDVSVAATARRP